MTISGCVGRETAPAGSPPTFKLINVEWKAPALPGPAEGAAADRGGRGSDPDYYVAETYLLEAPAAINLASHVDHHVDVTGSVAAKVAPAPVSPSEIAEIGAPAPDQPGSATELTPTFIVASLRMVAATCRQ
jgi:hypothetical protein